MRIRLTNTTFLIAEAGYFCVRVAGFGLAADRPPVSPLGFAIPEVRLFSERARPSRRVLGWRVRGLRRGSGR